jgi:tripartite-type tricarboxylate transporter receptor subunit TctC
MQDTIDQVLASDAFDTVRRRNRWALLHHEGQAFFDFLVDQERQIGELMRDLGFLRN